MFSRILKAVLTLAVVAILVAFVWLVRTLYHPVSFPEGRAVFEVERGTGVATVGEALAERGLIKSKLAFLALYRLFFHPETIKAGEYAVSSPARSKDLLEMLVRGKVLLHSVTIPEGLTALEICPLFEHLVAEGRDDFAASLRDTELVTDLDPEATDLEGYLFPETYLFPRGVSAREAIGTMVGQFRTVMNGLWPARPPNLRLSLRQAVILASLIEKETSIGDEKRLVSAVFHNRLRRGMKLDCDPTIIYALKLAGSYEGRLSKNHLSLDSPYNTYRYAGLPPGPICNPGREALQAALFPAAADYLYFVSRNDGSHEFSRTYSEHLAAVRRYQQGR